MSGRLSRDWHRRPRREAPYAPREQAAPPLPALARFRPPRLPDAPRDGTAPHSGTWYSPGAPSGHRQALETPAVPPAAGQTLARPGVLNAVRLQDVPGGFGAALPCRATSCDAGTPAQAIGLSSGRISFSAEARDKRERTRRIASEECRRANRRGRAKSLRTPGPRVQPAAGSNDMRSSFERHQEVASDG